MGSILNKSQTVSSQSNQNSPFRNPRGSANTEKIMEMIVNSDENQMVAFNEPKPQGDPPISILKNRIWPRNPCFPDKCLTGYENLKQRDMNNPRNFAVTMNQTCENILYNNLYIKNKAPSLDWNKSIEGKDFKQRTNEWMYQKEKKIEYLRYMLSQRETEECTFKPDTERTSPTRHTKWK